MRIAISQSNYLPWRGYFGVIASVDCFIFLDEVQFTSRDWRSRNRIKTKDGLKWLSIPVGASLSRRVSEVLLPKNNWQLKHKSLVMEAYKNSNNYERGLQFIEEIYLVESFSHLSEYNKFCIQKISREFFHLETKFIDSSQIPHQGISSDRILSIAKNIGAKEYITGPSGLNYLKISDFENFGIKVLVANFTNLPRYDQLHGEFVSNTSVVDLIFNVEEELTPFIKIGETLV